MTEILEITNTKSQNVVKGKLNDAHHLLLLIFLEHWYHSKLDDVNFGMFLFISLAHLRKNESINDFAMFY